MLRSSLCSASLALVLVGWLPGCSSSGARGSKAEDGGAAGTATETGGAASLGSGGGPAAATLTVTWDNDTPLVINLKQTRTLQADGATGAVAWSLLEGELPPGMELSEDGQLRGRPTTAGSYPVVLRGVDRDGTQGELSFTLIVEYRSWVSYVVTTKYAMTTQRFLVNLADSKVQRYPLLTGAVGNQYPFGEAAFSPDGSRFAYLLEDDSQSRCTLHVHSLRDDAAALSVGAAEEKYACGLLTWSADGRRLAVVRLDSEDHAVPRVYSFEAGTVAAAEPANVAYAAVYGLHLTGPNELLWTFEAVGTGGRGMVLGTVSATAIGSPKTLGDFTGLSQVLSTPNRFRAYVVDDTCGVFDRTEGWMVTYLGTYRDGSFAAQRELSTTGNWLHNGYAVGGVEAGTDLYATRDFANGEPAPLLHVPYTTYSDKGGPRWWWRERDSVEYLTARQADGTYWELPLSAGATPALPPLPSPGTVELGVALSGDPSNREWLYAKVTADSLVRLYLRRLGTAGGFFPLSSAPRVAAAFVSIYPESDGAIWSERAAFNDPSEFVTARLKDSGPAAAPVRMTPALSAELTSTYSSSVVWTGDGVHALYEMQRNVTNAILHPYYYSTSLFATPMVPTVGTPLNVSISNKSCTYIEYLQKDDCLESPLMFVDVQPRP